MTIWNMLCIMSILTVITRGRQIKCYNCSSEEWDVNEGCEFPNNKTPTVICRMACETLYLKGDTYLLRGCVRRKANLDILDDHFCYEDRCNNDIKWEKINVDNKNYYGGMIKSCFRCLSTKKNPDASCETVSNETKYNDHCDRKRCTVFYKENSREIKRDCYAWSKLSQYIEELPGDDWTIDWCDTENCNDESMSEYPGCKGAYFDFTKTDPDWGCVTSLQETTAPATIIVYANCSVVPNDTDDITSKCPETNTTTEEKETTEIETTHRSTTEEETVRLPIMCAAEAPAFNFIVTLFCNSFPLLWIHKINNCIS